MMEGNEGEGLGRQESQGRALKARADSRRRPARRRRRARASALPSELRALLPLERMRSSPLGLPGLRPAFVGGLVGPGSKCGV